MKKLVGWLVAVKLTRKITKIIKQDHKKEEHKKEKQAGSKPLGITQKQEGERWPTVKRRDHLLFLLFDSLEVCLG